MELSEFFRSTLPIFFVEVLAASAGLYYLKKTTQSDRSAKYFVIFLWITVFVEFVGSYAPAAYFSNYQFFPFVKGTNFENNYWWYNLYSLFSYSFLVLYFISFIKNRVIKKIFSISVAFLLCVSIGFYIFTDSFFKITSQFVSIVGALMVFFSVALFYFELLRNDLLLQLKRFLPFYLSVGVLAFNLCVTPVEIFSQYFNLDDGNDLFVKLHINVLLYANLFMYSVFIIGFLVCSRKKKSSY